MTGSAWVLLAWAALLGVLGAILWTWSADPLPPALLTVSAAATALGALLLIGQRGAAGGGGEARAVPDLSLATVTVSFALAAILVGLEFGLGLLLIGGGILVAGLAGVVREALGVRRRSNRG